MPAEIIQVEKDSIAEDLGLAQGDLILKINGVVPKDYIDYKYLTACEELDLLIKHADGTPEIFEIEKDFDEDLGIVFKSAVFDRIKPCTNHCIFCFVDGQPDGLRDTLYIKDDDYRLSYLQGSYVTLTNLTDKDRERISQMHLGPLYVSVHTMNPELRVKMLRNPKAKNISQELDFLKKNDIPFHAQIVLCPDYNDGKELEYTLNQLYKYKKVLLSVAIVPVGITKFRKDCLKTVDKEIAEKQIEIVNEFNKKKKNFPVCLSDEFFLIAGCEVPERKYYGNFSQIEDGVGAIRLLTDSFYNGLKLLPNKLKKKKSITFALAKSSFNTFIKFKDELDKIENLEIEMVEIVSTFWGKDITVAGLLSSSDLINCLKDKKIENLIIPSVMLSPYTNEFIDGVHFDDFKKQINCKIHVIKDIYSFDEIFNLLR